MDISGLSNQITSLNSQTVLPEILFQRLAQMGSISASVASISKGQALLTSQLGQILTANTLDLKVGDRLTIRSNNHSQRPALKVSLQPPQPFTINTATNKSLGRILTPAKSATAVIVNQFKAGTTIESGNQQFKTQSLPDLKIGQLISLTKSSRGDSIEIRPINHQQILKAAVGRLIPQQVTQGSSSDIVKAVRLVNDFAQSNGNLAKTMQLVNATISQASAKAELAINNNGPASSLEVLIRSMPELSKLDSATIRQWLSRIINPVKSNIDREPLAQSPHQLLQGLAKSETDVIQQLKQFVASSKQDSAPAPDHSVKKGVNEEALQMTGRELVKVGEQSINQQLFQQTSLRLQQEQQQPLLLHLSMPLNDQDKLTELGIMIRQRKPESDPQNQVWEIRLDFEAGSLGDISTHLSLSGDTVSASFWSRKIETQQKIESSLNDFQTQITQAGLVPGQFHSFHGKPSQEKSVDIAGMPETLLDIRV